MHGYQTRLHWDGSTSDGIRSYSRDHVALAPPAANRLELSADPAFRGDAARFNPEQLVVMAASSCQMLSFLAVAAQAGIDVRSYDDKASSSLNTTQPPARLDTIRLTVTVTVGPGVDEATVRELAEQAHRECYIANSLVVPVEVNTRVVIVDD